MAIENLQLWAEQLQAVHLPTLQAQVNNNRVRHDAFYVQYLAKAQQIQDNLDAHSARITTSQTTANLSRQIADQAISRIYQVWLDSRVYTDSRIQDLRDELMGTIGTVTEYVDSPDYLGPILEQVNNEIDDALSQFDPVTDLVQALYDQIYADYQEVLAVSNEVLLQGLPAQSVLIDAVQSELAQLKTQSELTLAGFDYDTLIEGLEDTQNRILESLVPLGVSVVQAPASAWTTGSGNGTFSPKPPIPTSWFVTDPDMGACAQLPLGDVVSIGQSFPVDFSANRVYRVRARINVVNGGSTAGVKLRIGVSTWAGANPAQLNVEKELSASPIPSGLGDQIYTCVFSGDLDRLEDQSYSIGLTDSDEAVYLAGSAAANKAFFHVRQNFGGVTNGNIRISLLEVKDITEAVDAVKIVKLQLQTQLDDMSATLETVSFAVSDLDTAMAGVTTRLDARSLPNLVSDADFSQPVLDAWAPFSGSTLSILTHGQTGVQNPKGLRMYHPGAGTAGAYSIPYPVGNYTNRLFRFRGKARASEDGIAFYGRTWLYRLGVPDVATDLQMLTLSTSYQPFDVIIRALYDEHLDCDQVRLALFHQGAPVGSWSEVTDVEIYDVTGSETSIADIAASLSTVYYTKVETDAAISEGITTFSAEYFNPGTGQVKATALTDYYTKASVDSAVSASIESFEAEFRDPTSGQIKATALTGYFTQAETNSAISSASTTLTSAINTKGKVIFSATAPDVADQLAQNLWIDTAGGANTPRRWNGLLWIQVTDKTAADAVAAVAATNANLANNYYTKTDTDGAIAFQATTLGAQITTAQGTADGRGKVIFSNVSPSVGDQLVQNLWIDTTGGANTPKRWNGTAWAAVSDKAATDALSQATTTAASLTLNYYTKVATDSAIAAQITTYNSTLIGPSGTVGLLSANLTTNYYTRAATDTAISNASTTLSAATAVKGKVIYSTVTPLVADQLPQNLWIDTAGGANTPKRWTGTAWVAVSDKVATDAAASTATLTANLSTNYYTKTAADSAIASAVNTFEAEFRDPASGQIKATALTGYYTKTAADSAISAATLNLKSTMEGPGGSVLTAQEAANTANTLAGGKGKVLYQSTTPVTADRLSQNLWIDTTGSANTPKRWNGTAWVAVTDKVATDAAAAAAAAQSSVSSLSATLSSSYLTSVQTNTAIASADTALKVAIENPNGTSLGATVKTAQAAIADLEGNAAAMLAFRVKAGTAGAQLELIASDNPGGALSAARITADNIILNGSVKTNHLEAGSITTNLLKFGVGSNLVENSDFKQGMLHWQGTGTTTQTSVQLTSPGGGWAGATYNTIYAYQNGTSTAGYYDIANFEMSNDTVVDNRVVACKPGDYFAMSAQVSSHRCTGQVLAVFWDRLGNYIGEIGQAIATNNGPAGSDYNPDLWPQYWKNVQVPATLSSAGLPVAFIQLRIRKNGTLAGNTDSYLFAHKPLLVRSHANMNEAPLYSRAPSTIIDGGRIKTGSITAASGVIGDLAVDTLQIAGQAVTVPVFAYSYLGGWVPPVWGNYGSALAVTLNKRDTSGVYILVTSSQDAPNGNSAMRFRILRNGSELVTWDLGVDSRNCNAFAFVDYSGASGSHVYTVQASLLISSVIRVFNIAIQAVQFRR